MGIYREYFEAKGMFENAVYPGIPELLGSLKKEGYKLYVATSKPEPFAEMIIEHIGAAGYFDAVAGINAGGFVDPDGQGNGSIPDTLTVVDGKIYMGGIGNGFVGFDADHIMHVGCNNEQEILDAGIQYGVCFGPVLIQNGEPCELEYHGGINPRTAIGQRSDGAVLMLVIDGRQVASIGATYVDETEIMMRYGAVNACNLDGGSSSLMWFDGGYVNNCASVIGIRPVPTSFLVLKAGEGENG